MRSAVRETPTAYARVALPGGVWRDDCIEPIRELEIREVGPEDDEFLLETRDKAPGERAVGLLARCLVNQSDREEIVRSLTIGDRETLLLHLRRLTIGDPLEALLRCPAEVCGTQMDLELATDDLLVPPYADVRREYDLELDREGAHHEIRFRLPTAGDLERVVAVLDPEDGAGELLRGCILRATEDGVPETAEVLSSEIRLAVGRAMIDRDPQAELELDATCPACGGRFSALLDTATFFLRELDERATRLVRDVHVLASHYHWSERAILRMPATRRAQYLELIAGMPRRPAASARVG